MPPPTRHAVVTGAANGLGRALAVLLVGRGWLLTAFDTDAQGLAGLAAELGAAAVHTRVLDVSDRQAWAPAIAAAVARHGAVDLLVANAGLGEATKAAAFAAGAYERIFQVNVLGACHAIAAVLPAMLARRSGHIVGVGSLAGVRGFPSNGSYSASKAALMTQLEALRVELKPLGVCVTTVAPGFIATPMTAGNRLPMPLVMTAEAAARKTLAAIERRRGVAAFPWPMAMFARFMRILPAPVFDRLAKPYMTPEALGQ